MNDVISLRQKRRFLYEENKKYGARMQRVDIGTQSDPRAPFAVWRSREYLAQLFPAGTEQCPAVRISINRAELDNDGGWKDGISWEEMMRIKSEVGYGDMIGVEIYPPDKDTVNVSNMRHIWIFTGPSPLPDDFIWRNE